MKEIEYSPNNPDYINKTRLISELAERSINDPEITNDLLNLGQAATINMRLSGKQSQELVNALHKSKVLTYFQNYLKSPWSYRESSKHVDAVRAGIEDDGKIQFHILSLLYLFNTGTLHPNTQNDLLKCLLYRSHKEGFREIKNSDIINEPKWKKGLKLLNKNEMVLIKDYKKKGIQININKFKFEEEYDTFMIEVYRNKLNTRSNVIEKLSDLEEIACLGFTMGLRDGTRSEVRYRDNNCEDF